MTQNYPLAESDDGTLRGPRGRRLDELTLGGIADGTIGIEDLGITPEALVAQARVARNAGRGALADNFERAADLVTVPQEVIMDIYNLLRPGRAKDRQELLDQAARLCRDYGAERMAAFIEDAAEQYHRRGLFAK